MGTVTSSSPRVLRENNISVEGSGRVTGLASRQESVVGCEYGPHRLAIQLWSNGFEQEPIDSVLVACRKLLKYAPRIWRGGISG